MIACPTAIRFYYFCQNKNSLKLLVILVKLLVILEANKGVSRV